MKFELEMQMTERDKKLLIFISIFVLIVGFGYWGIRPLVNCIFEVNEQITDAEDVQALNEMKISQLPMLRVDNEKLETSIVEAKEEYYSMMTSDSIDKYFTNMVLTYNLESYDLDISIESESCTLEPYQYSEKAMKSTEETSEETQDNEEQEISNGIYAATVQMRLGGELYNLSKLVDDLSNIKQKLLVKNYSYTTEQNVQTTQNGEYSVSQNYVLNITVEIYMCED